MPGHKAYRIALLGAVFLTTIGGVAHAQTAVTNAPAVNAVTTNAGTLPPLTPPVANTPTAPMTPMPAATNGLSPTVVSGTPAAPPALSAPDASINGRAATTAPSLQAQDASGKVSGPTRALDARKGDDSYYDSHATVPSKQMAPIAGPRKVNPSVEPGQALVIVEGVRKAHDTESMVVAADRALNLGFYDSALNMYNTLAKKNARDPRILMGRAVAQQKLGMNDAAIESYNRVLDVSPNNVDAMVNMLGLLKQKDPQGALRHMVALGGRFPDDAGLAAQTGMAEGEAGNYDDAMRYLGKASALQPENPQHIFNMAVLADRQGDTASAVKFYQQAMQRSADDENSTIDRNAVLKRLAVLNRH